ncbi:hypothetical protein ABZZ80_35800, partial [Streptomyces sp. NPDC006356]
DRGCGGPDAGREGRDRVLDRPSAGTAEIVADVADLPDQVDGDVAMLTAPLDESELAEVSVALMARGLNVLTVHPEAFDPTDDFAGPVDEAAKRYGVSFLATGVQDTWWVHMPAVAAGSMARLDTVRFEHSMDFNTVSKGVGASLGVGRPVEEAEELYRGVPSELGGPMRVLARRLGLTPGEVSFGLEPVTAEHPREWTAGGEVIAPGLVVGVAEHVRMDTEEGVEFHGTMLTVVMPEDMHSCDLVVLEGDPTLRLEHRPFPGEGITYAVPVSRITDIREAAPGLHTAATLAPAAYRGRRG